MTKNWLEFDQKQRTLTLDPDQKFDAKSKRPIYANIVNVINSII